MYNLLWKWENDIQRKCYNFLFYNFFNEPSVIKTIKLSRLKWLGYIKRLLDIIQGYERKFLGDFKYVETLRKLSRLKWIIYVKNPRPRKRFLGDFKHVKILRKLSRLKWIKNVKNPKLQNRFIVLPKMSRIRGKTKEIQKTLKKLKIKESKEIARNRQKWRMF